MLIEIKKQYEHKCWECGRVYFSKFAGQYDEDCDDCVVEGDSNI